MVKSQSHNLRQRIGIGLGRGYKNLVLSDPYIHSLSAKGIKSKMPMLVGKQKNVLNLKKYSTKKMDSEWKRSLSEKNQSYLKDFQTRLLYNKLLSYGGENVALVFDDDTKKILSRGELWDGKNSYMKIGKRSGCHYNSCSLWSDNKERLIIYTGWALSNDGVWRQHSWLLDNDNGMIVETTEKRVAYFGFPMNKKESEHFYESNLYAKGIKKKQIKISTYTRNHFNVDEKNLLNSKDKYNGANVFNFMYNPETGEMLLGDRTSHSDLLRSRDAVAGKDSNFNAWVRGKYDNGRNIIFVRHYFNPKSHYAEFTSEAFNISERMQLKMINVLKSRGLPKDVTIKYNQTNETLKDEGFVHV